MHVFCEGVSIDYYCATACNTTRGIAKAFLFVRLSVKHVDCDKMKDTCAHILIPHDRSFILVFGQKEWLVGCPLLREILGQTDPV